MNTNAQGSGLVSKISAWGLHPSYSNGTALDWAAGLVLILMLSLLWSQVVMQIVD